MAVANVLEGTRTQVQNMNGNVVLNGKRVFGSLPQNYNNK